jgi:hypothetical protein
MPTNTYVVLGTYTVPSTVSSYNLAAIPQGYTDLEVVCSVKITSGGLIMRPNNNTSAVYSSTYLRGNGFAASSYKLTTNDIGGGGTYLFNGAVSNTNFTSLKFSLQQYSNTNVNKTILCRFNNTENFVGAGVLLANFTDAITSLEFSCDGGGQIAAGSTFSVYGIAATSIGAKATGGDIYTDSQYFYHVFDASGTFTPLQSLTAYVLVVAGGGVGGYLHNVYSNRSAGGAGAGGLLGFASQSLTATNYTITVGAGGSGANNNTSGINSQFGALTASVGGGFGGVPGTKNADNGGSGGGGADNNINGSGTSGQGFAGNQGFDPGSGSTYAGGGGGGATAAGSLGSANNGGAGGAGSSAYATWASATGTGLNGVYAAGGRGGSSATGSSSLNALASTGNGGIGSAMNQNTAGGNGGSGIVIVRYLKA